MNISEEKIRVVLTGGTIDSHWEATKDTAVPNEHSVVPKFLEGLKLYVSWECVEVCMKDSRSLTREDLNKVLETIDSSPERKFIVTHGTYTMPDTARFLQANLQSTDKTIVLIGSMTPLQGFDMSDAQFNLGFAMAQVLQLEPGVYVCMNGASLTANEAVKNVNEGRFYSIFQKKQ